MALVTGAADGVGRAAARRVRDGGFQVAAADVEPAEATSGVTGYQLDVAHGADESLVSHTEQEPGPLAAGRLRADRQHHAAAATVGEETGKLACDVARAGLGAAPGPGDRAQAVRRICRHTYFHCPVDGR